MQNTEASSAGWTLEDLLHRMMPMHLLVDGSGLIRSAGRTMARMGITAGQSRLFDAFEPAQSRGRSGTQPDIAELASGRRLFLRQKEAPHLTIRGHGAPVPGTETGVLLNFGFGVALPEAVVALGMTDEDSVPSDLCMEMLFLQEANNAVRAELTNTSVRLEEARLQAERQAFTDPMTGLYNRRGLEVALSMLVRRMDGVAQAPEFVIAHLDLDRFKEVNDTGGHLIGDAVLCAVAERLRAQMRARDTVARVGGDEFVMLISESLDDAALDRLGRRMITRIEEPIEVAGREWKVSASIGMARPERGGRQTYDALIRRADKALYLAKQNGRGRTEIYSEILEEPGPQISVPTHQAPGHAAALGNGAGPEISGGAVPNP
ncbi:sensor domain-containing diguanylate cyclase [Paracoccus pacificus]|uniref:Diguanylate cyclase domain-containing protein n=1 Tax=Paracoccus pacificus TaxID=1463598 RepID=A0ABW4R4B0_9RHOB